MTDTKKKGRVAFWLVALALGAAAGSLGYFAVCWWCGNAAPDAPPAARIRDRDGVSSSSTGAAPDAAASPIVFRDVSDESGIALDHTDGSGGLRYIVEQMRRGIASLDYDGDGLVDLYLPNGAPLPGTPKPPQPPRHALYKNLGGWRFQDATRQAGVDVTAYGLAVAVGDYDDDGLPDVYLSNFGPNILLRNEGDGRFSDVTTQTGVARDAPTGGGLMVGGGACFFDYDLDGRLDLYVGNYIALDCSRHVPHLSGGIPAIPSPTEYTAKPDTLYRNEGDGRFADVSRPAGVAAHAGRSMGLIAADYDESGWPSVFVCNDVQENFLFHNEGGRRFGQAGVAANVAFNSAGHALANMGVDCADYDNDGLLDFFTTNFSGQLPMLLRNLGGGVFEDVALRTNAGAGSLPHVNWGAGVVDLDNDGWRDLFIANGHTDEDVEKRDTTLTYRCPAVVLHNRRGRFVDVSAAAGDSNKRVVARGVVFEDFDGDGDLDVVILDARRRPLVLRNMYYERGGTNHWLELDLRGVKTNRGGVGAKVRVAAGGLTQVAEVYAGRCYQSHWGSRLHFGLSAARSVERIDVTWPGGGVDTYRDVPIDRVAALVEGAGRE